MTRGRRPTLAQATSSAHRGRVPSQGKARSPTRLTGWREMASGRPPRPRRGRRRRWRSPGWLASCPDRCPSPGPVGHVLVEEDVPTGDPEAGEELLPQRRHVEPLRSLVAGRCIRKRVLLAPMTKSVVNSDPTPARRTPRGAAPRARASPLKMVTRFPMTPFSCSSVSVGRVLDAVAEHRCGSACRPGAAGPNSQLRMSTLWIECSSNAPPPAWRASDRQAAVPGHDVAGGPVLVVAAACRPSGRPSSVRSTIPARAL